MTNKQTDKVNVVISEDRKKVSLAMFSENGVDTMVTLSEEELINLITLLGEARWRLKEEEPVSPIVGARFTPVRKTQWAVQADLMTEGSMFIFQHPAYGPVGVSLLPADVDKIIVALQSHKNILHDFSRKQKRLV
ncbi:hypothetical protein [Entomobacter blattae]|uniref:Uncharacterized protein n=1 Tax=Entomobacter blattae TaxID=2762277 RepID=A0A7H1NQ02_9PROT|nr:hypothetical protein [Entomobacter blattae]QNT77862.1 hypothetical protein JGUZn3_06200 [Entomobacter blattae]